MARRHLKSPWLLSEIDPYTWLWSPNGHGHGHEWPTPTLCSMSIGPPIQRYSYPWPRPCVVKGQGHIWTWKFKGQGHGDGQTDNYIWGKFHIWPWKFKVMVMVKVKPNGHIWCLEFNWTKNIKAPPVYRGDLTSNFIFYLFFYFQYIYTGQNIQPLAVLLCCPVYTYNFNTHKIHEIHKIHFQRSNDEKHNCLRIRKMYDNSYQIQMTIHIKYKWELNKTIQSTICSNGSLKFLRDLLIEQRIYDLLLVSLFKYEYTVWCLNFLRQCIPKDTTIVYKWPFQSGWIMARYMYI